MTKPWNLRTDKCKYIESIYPCPINNCTSHTYKTPIRWTHSNCGGYFRLYENGKEKCQRCGEEDLFCNWDYSCNKDNKTQKYGKNNILTILQFLVGLDDSNVSIDFWLNIKMCFYKQREKYPEKFI